MDMPMLTTEIIAALVLKTVIKNEKYTFVLCNSNNENILSNTAWNQADL